MLILEWGHIKIGMRKKALIRSLPMKDMGLKRQIMGMYIIRTGTKEVVVGVIGEVRDKVLHVLHQIIKPSSQIGETILNV